MGILDLPGPLLAWLDDLMTPLPPLVRLVIWGAAAGAVSMWLYRIISPQARIARNKQDQLEVRRKLDGFDGELSDAWPLIRRLLGLSLAQVGRVTGPAVVASLPVLFLLVWVSTAYGHRYPEQIPEVQVVPTHLRAEWRPGNGVPAIVIAHPGRREEIDVSAPVPVIEKRRWWNALVGNPAGYLDPQGPAERVTFNLPRQHFVQAGPDWVRGWELPFFVSLIGTSLLLKRALRIQ